MNLIFFFSWSRYPTKKGRKTASMRVAYCCKPFPFFSVDTSIHRKNIRFISCYLIFFAFNIENFFKAGYFTTFNVVDIHATVRWLYNIFFGLRNFLFGNVQKMQHLMCMCFWDFRGNAIYLHNFCQILYLLIFKFYVRRMGR